MTKRLTILFLSTMALVALAVGLGGAMAAPSAGATERVSLATDGTQGNKGSEDAALSGDGRYVAFESEASNLVANDTNSEDDIFVRDRQTGQTSRITVGPGGAQANGDSDDPDFSADGRFVAYDSMAGNLVAGDTNGVRDVFVYEMATGVTERVSLAADGSQASIPSSDASISGDGRYVAFESLAALVPQDSNNDYDVYLRDRQSKTTVLISAGITDAAANGPSGDPAISDDSKIVVFNSRATNLAPGNDGKYWQIFVRNLNTGTTIRISDAPGGGQGNGDSEDPAISGDGRFVAFTSEASNLVTGDTNGKEDVFVHDLQTGTTTRVSVGTGGGQGDGDSSDPAISADGRYVAFKSQATNLVPGDNNGVVDIFIRDRQTGTTTWVSVDPSGAQTNERSSNPAISADGRFVAFDSHASNLVANDTNAQEDVFVRDRGGTGPGPTPTVIPTPDLPNRGYVPVVAR